MLEFKSVGERKSNLKTIGTVASFVGANGYHELASVKNFKDDAKRVSIRLVNAEGNQVYVNCSKPLSEDLRASKDAEELQEKLEAISLLPILELPQLDSEGNPVMVVDEETGEEKPLVLYSISNSGATDMSKTRVSITEAMLQSTAKSKEISFADLVAL